MSGYLPEGCYRFSGCSGWNPGDDRELLSMEELVIESFSLERVSKGGARFDYEKGKWFNHQYIQQYPSSKLAKLALPYIGSGHQRHNAARLGEAIELVKDRLYLIPDVVRANDYLFMAPTSYDEKGIRSVGRQRHPSDSESFIDLMEEYPEKEKLEEMTPLWIQEKGYSMGGVMNAIRLALVGKLYGTTHL